MPNKFTRMFIDFDKNFPQFQVPIFVSGPKYSSLTIEVLSTRQKKAKLFTPNLNEKVLSLGFYTSICSKFIN